MKELWNEDTARETRKEQARLSKVAEKKGIGLAEAEGRKKLARMMKARRWSNAVLGALLYELEHGKPPEIKPIKRGRVRIAATVAISVEIDL